MKKISPMLWFDNQAEEAANFYVSVFKNAKILKTLRWGSDGPGAKGSVMTVHFELDGAEFTALNGGPHFKFNEAVSFVVDCKDQKEVDEYWSKLTAGGGEESMCGWLKDKYGLSWQIVPSGLVELVGSPDAKKAKAATQAMLKMRKLDIAALRAAYEQA